MSAQQFSMKDVTEWYRSGDRPIFLGDVVDADSGKSMSVGFARYGAGSSNEWHVTYDEVLIITKGTFGVKTAEGDQIAKAGEVIYLTKDTKLVYHAITDAELVYVSYPHWAKAQSESDHAHLIDTFHPAPENEPFDIVK